MRESEREGVEYEGRGTAATRAFFDARDTAPDSDRCQRPRQISAMIIEGVELLDGRGEPAGELPFLSPCTVRIRYHCPRPIHSLCSICASTRAASASSRRAC